MTAHSEESFNGIELCRFACAFAVLIWHYQHFFFLGLVHDKVTAVLRPGFPLYHLLLPFYWQGGLAVQIFWAISGFIFFWKYAGPIYEGGVSAYNFFILRMSRLYPLHIVTLLLVLVLQLIYRRSHPAPFIYPHDDLPHFILHLFFASNWLGRELPSFNGPIWSVSIEVLAYAVFFVTLRCLLPTIGLCLGAVILTQILYGLHADPILSCLSFFFAGGFVERCLARLDRAGQTRAFWTAGAITLLLIGVLAAGRPLSPAMVVLLAASLVGWCALLDTCLPFRLPGFSWLGNMTYSSYLIHFPLQLMAVIVLDALGLSRALFLSPIALLLYLGATFGLAALVYRAFEWPVQNRLRRHLLRRGAAARELGAALPS
jgi:peptidoglycan/LPS O-acetylase OafA/YrhL